MQQEWFRPLLSRSSETPVEHRHRSESVGSPRPLQKAKWVMISCSLWMVGAYQTALFDYMKQKHTKWARIGDYRLHRGNPWRCWHRPPGSSPISKLQVCNSTMNKLARVGRCSMGGLTEQAGVWSAATTVWIWNIKQAKAAGMEKKFEAIMIKFWNSKSNTFESSRVWGIGACYVEKSSKYLPT